MVSSVVKSFWVLAFLAMCVLSLCHDQNPVPKMAAEDCEVDLRGFEIECMYYMHKGMPYMLLNPNDRCCKVIKEANIPCCCNNLSRKLVYPPGYTIEDMLDWGKVLHCFNNCGRPLPAEYKCGTFTVPPGPPSK
ncbi:hypothetical protein VNO77_26918 [Canavalia gladiata]|uniref:Bifunctional inhibitor/plant lipid transfer protein/seed storage helical domain-containing protein n=1 Tax=Canavalia gladiata TaxID=3824 RepID=A0AAN9KT43_CANGL